MELKSSERLTLQEKKWFKLKSPNHFWKGLFNLEVERRPVSNPSPKRLSHNMGR